MRIVDAFLSQGPHTAEDARKWIRDVFILRALFAVAAAAGFLMFFVTWARSGDAVDLALAVAIVFAVTLIDRIWKLQAELYRERYHRLGGH